MIRAQTILVWPWALIGMYWLISALRTKKTAVNEAPATRLLRLTLLCLMFTLLLTDWLRIGPLAWRFVPDHAWIRWLGIVVTMAGLTLCLWARTHLGAYWSDKVALKVDHQLIRSGPYALLRHPIYSGVLLAVAGSALAIGEWRGMVVFVIMAANYWVKAGREERILSGKFGEAYADYKRRAGFLFPRLQKSEVRLQK
jgi:protein-S-isoprenylcysteine O-methyltransferase Ste14